MEPTKIGEIVKFITPLKGEKIDQMYVILEIIKDDIKPRAEIQKLNSGMAFPPINTVPLNDLEVAPVNTQDLIGEFVIINKADYSQVGGKVIKVIEQQINLELSLGLSGVETNVFLTIVDSKGKEHTGTLFVN